MHDDFISLSSLVIGILFGMLLISVLALWVWDTPECFYRKGQIDALTGIIKYELVINPDSTRIWKRKVKE